MSTPIAEAELPGDYTMGFVMARAIRTTGDTLADDDRYPGVFGSNGTVTFTPLVRQRRITGDVTAFVTHGAHTANFVNGILCDQHGQPGVYIVSGLYRVSFSFTNGETLAPFDIEVTPYHTQESPLDLVTVAPYVWPPNVNVTTLQVASVTLEEYQAIVNPNPSIFYMVHMD